MILLPDPTPPSPRPTNYVPNNKTLQAVWPLYFATNTFRCSVVLIYFDKHKIKLNEKQEPFKYSIGELKKDPFVRYTHNSTSKDTKNNLICLSPLFLLFIRHC